MFFSKHLPVKFTSVAPASYGVYTPIIEYGSSSVPSAESFTIHAQFSKLLTEVDHHRISVHTGGNDQCGNSFTRVAGKEIRSDTLLVVILQEVEHLFLYSIQTLPAMSDSGCRFISTSYIAVSYTHLDVYKRQAKISPENENVKKMLPQVKAVMK